MSAEPRGLRIVHVATIDRTLRYQLFEQLLYQREIGHEVIGIAARGPWTDEIRSRGIEVISLPLTRRVTPLSDARHLWALWRLFRRIRPDVVHTHTPKAALLGQWAARLAGVAGRVHTIHGLYLPAHVAGWRARLLLLMERALMSQARLVLSQNREDLELCRAERLADPRILRFLGNGIDLERFRPAPPGRAAEVKRALGILAEHRVVGMVARLTVTKGYRVYLAAAKEVLAARDDVTFLAIGPEEPEKADQVSPAELAAAGLGERFRYLGNRDDIVDLYAAMDLCVLSSFLEGVPRTIMEASAMGVAVVGSSIRGTREAIADGSSGLLVPPGDASGFARAILALLGDDERRRRLGEGGRRLAAERFDQREVFRRIDAAYAEVARSPRREGQLGVPREVGR